jgi:hypothetical protein
MASQVLIKFGTAALDKAKGLVTEIGKSIRETIGGVENVGLRGGLRQTFRDAVKAARESDNDIESVVTRRRRSPDSLNAPALGDLFSSSLDTGASLSRRVTGRVGHRIATLIQGGGDSFTGAALNVLQSLPGPVGDLFDVADKINTLIEKKVKEEVEARVKAEIAPLQGELDKIHDEFLALRDPAALAEQLAQQRLVEDKIHELGYVPETAAITGF